MEKERKEIKQETTELAPKNYRKYVIFFLSFNFPGFFCRSNDETVRVYLLSRKLSETSKVTYGVFLGSSGKSFLFQVLTVAKVCHDTRSLL